MRSISKRSALGFLLLVILSACGGGKGSGVAPTGPVDPSSSYQGLRNKARLTQANAESMVLNSFAGSQLTATVSGQRMLKAGDPISPGVDYQIRHLARVMKQSVRSMQLPKLAKERMVQARSRAVPSGKARVANRPVVQLVPGPQGGSAYYNLEVNDATGSFYGTVTFNHYISDGIMLSGPADMLGTFDITVQTISRMTLSFRSVTVSGASAGSFAAGDTMVGSLSWASNAAGTSESETINLVVVEGGKTYWWNNYQTVTSYGSTSSTQDVSGRYYDPDYGYVDFTTKTPVIAGLNDAWPSQGELAFNGDSQTSARLTFLPTSLDLGVDGDGNGDLEWHTQKTTNEQSTANFPPVAAAGTDQNVTQGALVSLDGSASSDPNGDSLTYLWTFASCPDNACPAISNSTTAKPWFTAERAGTYTLSLKVSDGQATSGTDTVSITSTAAEPTTPGLLQMQWQQSTLGTYIGKAGLITTDLDGDGIPEIIASGLPGYDGTFWYILKRNPDGSYRQIWRSESYQSPLLSLTLADLTGDGKPDMVAVFTDGTVLVYDTATLRQVKSLKITGSLSAVVVADLDHDGKNEIIASDSVGVFVHSGVDGSLRWSLPSCGGTALAVGNVDSDSALEIISTGYGGKGYVIDAVTHTVQWEYANGFGARVALADLDGDGIQEIVAASGWQKITVYQAERRTPLWEISTPHDIDALVLQDVDGDGVPEIVYGDGQWGKVHAVDARTRLERWAVINPEHGVSGLTLADMDGDGKKEVIWGAGGTDSGPDHLYLADPASGNIKWQSQDVFGLAAVAVGDVDGDGELEIVTVATQTDSGGPGLISVFSAKSHVLKKQAYAAMSWEGRSFVKIADIDGDGKNEIVVVTSNQYEGVVQVFDGATLALKAKGARSSSASHYGLAIADVDNDGGNEIVSGDGQNIIVLDSALREKWRSTATGGAIYDLKVADLDGDGHLDIIAATGNKLVVYDGVTHDLKHLIDHPARALETADLDGDGLPELLVGRNDGKIDVFDGRSLTVRKTVSGLGAGEIQALRVADLGKGTPVWLVACDAELTVLGAGGVGMLWKSPYLSWNLGKGNHLVVTDSDADGLREVLVGGESTLYHFEVAQ